MGEGEGLSHEAGTVIFLASIIMWILLNFGTTGFVTDISDSFGSLIGKAIVPVFAPLGLGLLADRGSADLGDRGKRSGCVQLQCAVRDPEYYHISRDGKLRGAAGQHGIRRGKRVFADGILSSVCAVYSNDCDDPQGSGKRKTDRRIILFQLAVAWVVSFIAFHVAADSVEDRALVFTYPYY